VGVNSVASTHAFKGIYGFIKNRILHVPMKPWKIFKTIGFLTNFYPDSHQEELKKMTKKSRGHSIAPKTTSASP